MNIGFFTDCYLPQINGVVTSIESFRKELIKQGHTVYVFGPQSPVKQTREDKLREKRENIIRFFSIPYFVQPEYSMVFPFSYKLRHFEKYKLDIIHTQDYFPMGAYALYVAKRYKIPIVHTYHTLWAEYAHYSFLPRSISRQILITWSRIYCNFCRLIFTPSRNVKDILKGYNIDREIIVLPTGIEINTNEKKNDVQKTRMAHGLPVKAKILIFIGRLGKEKNLFFLFRAFKQVAQKHPDAVLVLIGDGPERAELKTYAEKTGIEKKILFLGYKKRHEVFDILNASDIFVFSSKTETQGLVLMEALSEGLPAVAVAGNGVVDVLDGDQGGFMVKENENAFAGKVSELLSDPRLYDLKVREARDRALSFSSSHLTGKLLTHYKQVIDLSNSRA
ncbi:MAG: glycosyltransferase [Spirochaetales bacterium]|nr:glycosyltransferase [Spirochaetales bacterium]